MSREEAIEIFKRLKENAPNEMHLEVVESAEELFDMAIQALNSLEEVYAKGYNDGFTQAEVNFENDKALSQEPCDNAISRDFEIGDEVRIIGSDPIYDDCDAGWVIRNASEKVKTMYVMRNDGSAGEEAKAEWYKTGRHNAMLAEVIKALPSVTQKSVIEDIKTEIKTEMEEHRDIDDFSKGVGYGLRSAIGIIERRTYDL